MVSLDVHQGYQDGTYGSRNVVMVMLGFTDPASEQQPLVSIKYFTWWVSLNDMAIL